jgi:hypothetical protein
MNILTWMEHQIIVTRKTENIKRAPTNNKNPANKNPANKNPADKNPANTNPANTNPANTNHTVSLNIIHKYFIRSFTLSLDSTNLGDIPVKRDGTADMRYVESREAVASGIISKDDKIEGMSTVIYIK